MGDNIKSKTLSGLLWQFLQKFISQIFSFCITVVLARLLSPDDYGVVALASMFNILVGIFISGSMDAALIQKKDADELDYNTVFYSSFLMSFVIYAVVYFGSPYFANLYHNELICPVMRVLALTMPIGSLAMVQNAIISRQLEFKKFFYSSLIGQVFSAVIGIVMAYQGFGPWALVAQQIASTITNTMVMFCIVRWYPKLQFSWDRFIVLFNFAWKKTTSSFIGTLCDQLKGYLIGFRYTTADLAYFNRGEGLPQMFNTNISGTINTVLFPALSQLQGDRAAVKRGMRRAMTTSCYILSPIFIGLAATSGKIVPLLYSSKWNPAIPFMLFACLTGVITVLNNANLQSIYAIGKSGEVLKLEFYKKTVMIVLLFGGIYFGPIGISVAMFLYSFYVLYMNTRPNVKFLNYSLLEQVNDVKYGLIFSVIMSLIVYGVGLLIDNIVLSLCIQIPLGIAIYVGLSEVIKPDAYIFVRSNLQEKYRSCLRNK
jgi:O-antigen/teichoic acid export membrane protein